MVAGVYKGKRGFFVGEGQGKGRMVGGPRNASIKELMSDRRFTSCILSFLRSTGVGRVKEGVAFSNHAL